MDCLNADDCVDIGAAYLFYGGPNWNDFDGTSEDADFAFEGTVADGHFGRALDGHGHANGNDFADLIIGAPGHDKAFTFFSPAE